MKYLLWIDEKDEGPYDKPQIVEMLSRSKITKETLCLPEDGNGDWKPIGSVPGLLDKDSPPPAPAVAPGAEVKDSGIGLVLKVIAALGIVASAGIGFSEGVIGGSGDAQRGWLIFAAGATGGLVLAGFGCIIDHSYECAQRLCRLEDLIQKGNSDKKAD
jgi:hypothetical protein